MNVYPAMYSYVCFVLFGLFSSIVSAGPNQINVIGLVPGVSSSDQVMAAGTDHKDSNSLRLEIGGHSLGCEAEFIEDKLAQLMCVTGKQVSDASNIVIHDDLAKGFTKKFGRPDVNVVMPMRTRLGVTHKNSIVEWKDKHGNRLTLFSMVGTVNDGAVIIKSAVYLKENAEEKSRIESQRKF